MKKTDTTLWVSIGIIASVIVIIFVVVILVIASKGSSTDSITDTCSNPQIKGNISKSGEKIYHKPGDMYYSQTEINESAGEKMFCTEKDAQDAGWRHSKI